MRDEQTTNIEDRATQPMEAGGWVSQFVNVSCDSSKVEAGSGETGSSWFSDGSQRRGLEGGLFALPGPWVTILHFIVTICPIFFCAVQLKNTTSTSGHMTKICWNFCWCSKHQRSQEKEVGRTLHENRQGEKTKEVETILEEKTRSRRTLPSGPNSKCYRTR